MILDLVKTLCEHSWLAFEGRRNIRVRTHWAFGYDNSQYLFVNVVNLSKEREVELTHAWIEWARPIEIRQPDRVLPRRLKPDESWETWIAASVLPHSLRASQKIYGLARIRMSTGAIVSSKKNSRVPGSGNIPGGPVNTL